MDNTNFGFLKVKCLFISDWYDGPLAGVCEYNNEKLYYHLTDELIWDKKDDDGNIIKIIYVVRVFTIYRLPENIIQMLIDDNASYELAQKENDMEEYFQHKPTYPEYLKNYVLLEKYAHENNWLVGYTTEDYWDMENVSGSI